ncbi:MAG: hypothetical protein ACOCXS_02730 [Bacteroidota bacterium]
MKKLLISLALVFSTFSMGKAQEAGTLAYNIGDTYAQAGISFGYLGYGFSGSRVGFAFPITVSVEHGFHEFISAGAFLGIANWRYEYFGNKYGWTFVNFGGRGTLHFAGLMNDNLDTNIDLKKWDLYASFIAGLEIRRYSSDYYDDLYDNNISLLVGPFLGAKYMVSENFGVYLEGGRGNFGYGTLGVSLRF